MHPSNLTIFLDKLQNLYYSINEIKEGAFMRIITGTKKGKRLETPRGLDVRPTTDKIKEAIFSMLQFDLENCNFLDLFAGSGQMGIEALSRGAKSVTFVDASRNSINIVKKNILSTDFTDRSKVYNTDAALFLKKNNAIFDIAFLDPPYNKGILQNILPLLVKFINKKGFIICESSVDDVLPESIGEFSVFKIRSYGKILITTYKCVNVV